MVDLRLLIGCWADYCHSWNVEYQARCEMVLGREVSLFLTC